MPTISEALTLEENGWAVQFNPPKDPLNPQILVLLHGHTGNEHSLEIFAQRIPANYWRILPRAPFTSESGGYSWLAEADRQDNGFHSYKLAAQHLWRALAGWMHDYQLPAGPVHLMGFSQGAALAYTCLIQFPSQVRRTAGLAGFLPTGASDAVSPNSLAKKKIFVAHGRLDTTIPVERARETVEVLQAGGAEVTYCEDDVAHKLSARCFNGLGRFFRTL